MGRKATFQSLVKSNVLCKGVSLVPLDATKVLLYAAGGPDYQMALGVAAMSGVPVSQVTGNFVDAWNAVAGGQQLVIAVGGAALNALYYNPCGWTNPGNHPGGHTPFIVINTPTDTSPGANYFVNAAGTTALDTLQIASAYTYYAVTGTSPAAFRAYPKVIQPAERCVGSADVPCPILQTPAGQGTSQPYWGVDSATQVTSSFYDCVVAAYGKPDFWGRYLTRVSGVSDGLTTTEVSFLHSNGVKILPIFNQFNQATGYSNGQQDAQMAITAAKGLGIPNGVVIFADVEVTYSVDAQWIEGFVETLLQSPYLPGIYANPVTGPFNQAYCSAVSANSAVSQTILWSNEFEPGVSTKASVPAFNPASTTCPGTVWAWQYGENGAACSAGIDTDLVLPALFSKLW